MIANALRDKHRGMILCHNKRNYLIEAVEHHGSYVKITSLGRVPLILPLDAEVTVTP